MTRDVEENILASLSPTATYSIKMSHNGIDRLCSCGFKEPILKEWENIKRLIQGTNIVITLCTNETNETILALCGNEIKSEYEITLELLQQHNPNGSYLIELSKGTATLTFPYTGTEATADMWQTVKTFIIGTGLSATLMDSDTEEMLDYYDD